MTTQTADKATNENQLDQAIAETVQVNQPPYWGSRMFWAGGYENSLPWLDSPSRQSYLNRLRYHPQNSLFQSASLSLIRQITGTPYQIKGSRRVKWYQSVLNEADFGRGWSSFIAKILWDFLTLDEGAVIEIVGRGASDTPLDREAVTGIGHLDPLRCFFTDNYDFPVIYQDAHGEMHYMHRTRVIRLVDMPLTVELVANSGFCALSRAIGFVQQNIAAMTYVGESLSSEPPPGILNIGNLKSPQQFQEAYEIYEKERERSRMTGYKPAMRYYQPGDKADMEFIRFAVAPEGFDPEAMIRLEAQGIASALGIDPQDVLPLVSGNFGTGGEAKVLARKALGKTLGFLLKEIERQLNRNVLPDYLAFEFRHRDAEQSAEEMARAKTAMEMASQLALLGGNKMALQYLANNAQSFADVILDDAGQIRLYDDDSPMGEREPSALQIVSDLDTAETPTTAPVAETAKAWYVRTMVYNAITDAWSNRAIKSKNIPVATASLVTSLARHKSLFSKKEALRIALEHYSLLSDKALSDVREDFDSALMTQLNKAVAERQPKTTFVKNMLILLDRYDNRAFLAGVEDAGLKGYELTESDNKWLREYADEQRRYIEKVAEVLYADEKLTEDEIKGKPEMWWNKSVYRAYLEGMTRGSADPLMRWTLGIAEHCDSCKELSGQRRKLSVWVSSITPKSSKLDCGGYRCACSLKSVKGWETKKPLPRWAKERHYAVSAI